MNDETKEKGGGMDLAKIRNILLWIGGIIVVLTDLLAALELNKIEHLLQK